MSPDRQALLSLYHDDATALLDRALQAQHEPEGLHVAHAAIVEALADAHTDGREPGVATTVPDETAALRAQVERLTDLVRHARGPLHEDGLLTDAEYAALAEDSGAVVRLTTIAQLQGDVARETRAKNVAIGERDEAQADVAWLTEEVTRQTGATVDSVAEGLALARAGGIHRPVVNVRMGDALRARFAAENERDEARAALATARLDGARAMREAAAVSLESAVWTTDTRFSRVQAEEVAAIRALDPAAVVGSGS